MCMLFSALGYVIGSANSAIIITKLLYRKDIRFFGDGNAGTTNVFENINKFVGITVFCIDFLKGMISYHLALQPFFDDNYQAIIMSSVILGHDFPLFFELRGGTGITSLLGGIFAIDRNLALLVFSFFTFMFFVMNLLHLKIFGFNYLEESEALSFLFAIYLIFLRSTNILAKKYFLISLTIIVFKHRYRVLNMLRSKGAIKG